jgi:hypothetical protein
LSSSWLVSPLLVLRFIYRLRPIPATLRIAIAVPFVSSSPPCFLLSPPVCHNPFQTLWCPPCMPRSVCDMVLRSTVLTILNNSLSLHYSISLSKLVYQIPSSNNLQSPHSCIFYHKISYYPNFSSIQTLVQSSQPSCDDIITQWMQKNNIINKRLPIWTLHIQYFIFHALAGTIQYCPTHLVFCLVPSQKADKRLSKCIIAVQTYKNRLENVNFTTSQFWK